MLHLKEWLVPGKQQRMQQFFYHHTSLNKAYLYNKGKYLVYDTEMNQLLLAGSGSAIISTLPEEVIPNDLRDSSLFMEFRFDPFYYSIIFKKSKPALAPSFSEYISQQNKTEFLHHKIK